MPLPVGGSSGGCPAVWSISHHRGIAPARLRYYRLTPVARVAGPRCLAADPLLGCVPARLSLVVAMALGDVCHGPRCSPAGLGPVALEYRSCHWPGGQAASPECARPWGCGSLRRVPLLPSVCVRVRCPGPLGACSPVRAPSVISARCPWPLGACCQYARCVRYVCVLLSTP